jgi:hypothetical protein
MLIKLTVGSPGLQPGLPLYSLIVIALPLFAAADSYYQTDWTGGPGVQGPVDDWDDSFLISSGIDWELEPGKISILWADPLKGDGFMYTGLLTSSILDNNFPDPFQVEWGYLYFSTVTPQGTSVQVRLRTSFYPDDMGEWSQWLPYPCIIYDLVPQGGRYVQYQTLLSSPQYGVSPELKDVTVLIGWPACESSYEGIEQDAGDRLFVENPAHSPFQVSWNMRGIGAYGVTIYDMSGRTSAEVSHGEITPGSFSETVSGLSPGVYAAVLVTPGGSTVRRFALLP